jgi:hypothetical protein
MIDSLSVFIQYLKGCATAGSINCRQIASKTRYGEAWKVGSASIVARVDGGTANLDLPVQDQRVELRCFAESPLEARKLLNELIALSRTCSRVLIEVEGEYGLLYGFQQDSGPSELWDEDLKMNFAMMFFAVQVSE